MRAAIFLDRDGVIIENRPEYVRSWSDVQFLPGALEAMARLNDSPYVVILVTNQSAVGRGVISMTQALDIQRKIDAVIISKGGRIDDTFMCPHAPWEDCFCRKPLPGLLFQAAEKLSVDLKRSIMVGDALSDIQAGRSAGLKRSVMVLTGRGKNQILLEDAQALAPIEVYPCLSDFVRQMFSGSCAE
jgi:D-glycero-D-manno-heptose 1,7-bisphosphate phosphatase